MPDRSNTGFNEGEFKRLREEADAWQNHRTEFMLARLKEGHHPDTDADFWKGYKEAPASEVNAQPYFTTGKGGMALSIAAAVAILVAFVGLLVFATVWLIRWSKRRRAKAA
jgi:hypothetical protein